MNAGLRGLMMFHRGCPEYRPATIMYHVDEQSCYTLYGDGHTDREKMLYDEPHMTIYRCRPERRMDNCLLVTRFSRKPG